MGRDHVLDSSPTVIARPALRDRDDASQIRIDKSRCLEYLQDQLHI